MVSILLMWVGRFLVDGMCYGMCVVLILVLVCVMCCFMVGFCIRKVWVILVMVRLFIMCRVSVMCDCGERVG